MRTAKETVRELAERVLKQHGLCTAIEAQQFAKATLLYTGGRK